MNQIGAVACTMEKGTSGQKVDSIREHQSKSLISAGKNREKPDTAKEVVSERVVVDNNTLVVPAPVPVLGVPVSPGDKVKQDADKKIATGLQGAVDDAADWLDKATTCSFGRACSSDDTKQTDGPTVGKDLTDTEKAELGGAGSGTPGGWGPEDEENGRNNAAQNLPSKNNLSQAASSPNRNGLTDAGRALQKHG